MSHFLLTLYSIFLQKQDTGDIFKCGLSTAPPTDWLFYDSMYTERFMGLPTQEDNLIGYENSRLLDKVNDLRGKLFQVNHGVADDNVKNPHLYFDGFCFFNFLTKCKAKTFLC